MTYGDSFEDGYTRVEGYAPQVINAIETGTITVTVDGYGTLITPAGTFTDVLRVQFLIEAETIDYFSEQPTGSEMHSEEGYGFYSATYTGQLAFVGTYNYPNTSFQIGQYALPASTAELGDLGNDGWSELMLFPNPATDVANVSIDLNEAQIFEISILSLDGKVLKRQGGTFFDAGYNHVPISISDLAKGVYILRLYSDMGSATRKLIVK